MGLIKKYLQTASQKKFTLPWLLALIAATYVGAYFFDLRTPSFHSGYLGWWGWFDQGQYLKSANALLSQDLTPSLHFYPPLYSALGSVFLKFTEAHPFFLINLVCLLWFSFVFIRVCDCYIARWQGALILLGSTIFNYTIFENFVIPWTTTLGTALLSTGILGLVWIQDLIKGKRLKISTYETFFVAFSLSLLIPTRPVDAPIGFILGIAYLIGYWHVRSFSPKSTPSPVRFLPALIAGALIGPLVFFLFNKLVYGDFLGSYMRAANGNGFFFADFLEKFVSIWLDSKTLYGESGASLTEHFPWLLISFAGYFWICLRGDFLLRVIAIAIGAMLILYLPYGDLLPTGVFRYMNIHYFKWSFPYLALFGWILIMQVLNNFQDKANWIFPSSVLVLAPLVMMTLHITTYLKPLPFELTYMRSIVFKLPNEKIDFIDIKGISGGFLDIYFGGHKVLLDGHELAINKDFRLLPQSSDTRLLFIRPLKGEVVEFTPDPKLNLDEPEMLATLGNYEFSFGRLNLLLFKK